MAADDSNHPPTLDHTGYLARTYYPALDGFRAVSVLLVFLFHVRAEPFSGLHGALGVEMFFVLSGFLITTMLARERRITGDVDLGGFAIRRATRVLPLYFLVLAGYCVAILVLGYDSDRKETFLEALPYYLGFLQEVPLFQDIDRPFGVAWSLGIEEKFYLLWPLLGFAVLRSIRQRAFVAGAIAVTVYALGLATSGGRYVEPYFGILVGVLLALALHDSRTYDRVMVLARPRNAGIAAAVFAFLLLSDRFGGDLFRALFSLSVAAVLVGLIGGHGWVSRQLERPRLRWVGRISYGIYLTHSLVLSLAERVVPERAGELDDIATFVIALPVTLLLCGALGRYVERPVIEWGRRVARERAARQRRSVPATSAALPAKDSL